MDVAVSRLSADTQKSDTPSWRNANPPSAFTIPVTDVVVVVAVVIVVVVETSFETFSSFVSTDFGTPKFLVFCCDREKRGGARREREKDKKKFF
jgi:hypothetical protein